MRYVSTRGQVEPIAFQEAVMMGLADDGGLLIPESIPDVRDELADWRELSYAELAFEVIRRFAEDPPADDLRDLIETTYGEAFQPEVAPTVRVGPVHMLELWHGPTLAFKDVALQFLGNLFEYILSVGGGRLNILAATSGDTGSAAICGVRGRRGINIFVMHPHGRVSPIQARQMTTVLDDNVHNIAIDGSFDDCQRIMKELAGDLAFKRRYSLGAVNSVNWARVLAQIVYYFKGVFDVQRDAGAASVRVEVPTGNFGDILAAWYAREMGAPISGLILATNENDILARFFSSGEYAVGSLRRTMSPSMDIQVRLREVMAQFAASGSLRVQPGPDGVVDAGVAAGRATEKECLRTIREFHERHEYLLDPHTAVGVTVARRLARADEAVLCVATAHPAKFPDAIRKAIGRDLAHHPKIDALMELPTRCTVLPNDKEQVRKFIVQTIG